MALKENGFGGYFQNINHSREPSIEAFRTRKVKTNSEFSHFIIIYFPPTIALESEVWLKDQEQNCNTGMTESLVVTSVTNSIELQVYAYMRAGGAELSSPLAV